MCSRFWILLLALALAGRVPGHPTEAPDEPVGAAISSAAETQARNFAEVRALVADRQFAQAATLLRTIINAPSFASLPADARYSALEAAGRIALTLHQPALAHQYLVRATAMPPAGFIAWMARAGAADSLGDEADQLLCLTSIANQWPEKLSSFNQDSMARLIRIAPRISRSAELSLLKALFAANWQLKDGSEPSDAWRDLALLLVEDKRVADAVKVATRVTDLHAVISMRIDRRFDAVVAANPSWFAVDAAADRELRSLQFAADLQPHSLVLHLSVMYALVVRRHYAAALAASDSVLLAILSTNFPQKLYADYRDQYVWLLDVRATALKRATRWDDAVAQLTLAAQSIQPTGDSVSSSISLGALYCDLGRPRDAMATLAGMTGSLSPFGLMQLEKVRLEAAVQLGDAKQTTRSLGYLRVHRADAPASYRFALIVTNQVRAAANLLINQLRDPQQRIEALQEVQDYAEPPEPDWALEMRAREHSVIAQPAVQAAVRQVGRVEHYELESP
jgi:hypothetical protein